MKKQHKWLICAILYCVAIFLTTSSSVSTGESSYNILMSLFNLPKEKAEIINIIFRKSVHITAYGVLAILFYNSFLKYRYLKAWLLTTSYGSFDELYQYFIPDRTGAIIDVAINSSGAVLALVIVKLITMKWGKADTDKKEIKSREK